jgi:hypothetical protein
LADSILVAEQLINHLEIAEEKDKIELYDGVLGALWDASNIAQSDLTVGDEWLGLAKGYVTYSRLDHTISRTLKLIEFEKTRVGSGAGKSENVVKLYDTVLLAL